MRFSTSSQRCSLEAFLDSDMDQSNLFVPIASQQELEDKSSWANTTYQWPQRPFDEFCMAIGQALIAWAQLENRLEAVFTISLQTSSSESAHAVWASLSGFRARLDVTDGALKVNSPSSQIQERWSKIKERCRKKSLRRNDLAHGTMFYEHTNPTISKRFFLSSPDEGGSIAKRTYTSDAIQLRDAFHSISIELYELWDEIFAARNISAAT
ncbi:hypothetical protein FLX56_03550 [Synechococcus moorigangaii CMS01]|nr:hypothetical protein [Synechococcus moorigangaii CMS01]